MLLGVDWVVFAFWGRVDTVKRDVDEDFFGVLVRVLLGNGPRSDMLLGYISEALAALSARQEGS
jgi:hypothetical protein